MPALLEARKFSRIRIVLGEGERLVAGSFPGRTEWGIAEGPRAGAAMENPPHLGLTYLARLSAQRQPLRLQAHSAPEGSPCHFSEWSNPVGVGGGRPGPCTGSGHPGSASVSPQPCPTPMEAEGISRCLPARAAASSTLGTGRASDSLGLLFLIKHGPGRALLPGKS